MKWGKYGRAPGEFSAPQAIAIDKDDNVYVADTDNNRIQKFDSNGRFLMEIR
jgi:DNA-binding beta-propeller fold protein YncE